VRQLVAAERLSADLSARLDERDRELTEVREAVKSANGQVDALYRRVGELERATGQLGERVRAWRDWYARVAAASWWRRRRLPDAPEDVKPQLVE
jgi:predicted nuclease with TOPRIM domain